MVFEAVRTRRTSRSATRTTAPTARPFAPTLLSSPSAERGQPRTRTMPTRTAGRPARRNVRYSSVPPTPPPAPAVRPTPTGTSVRALGGGHRHRRPVCCDASPVATAPQRLAMRLHGTGRALFAVGRTECRVADGQASGTGWSVGDGVEAGPAFGRTSEQREADTQSASLKTTDYRQKRPLLLTSEGGRGDAASREVSRAPTRKPLRPPPAGWLLARR